ncbi:single-stranded DNA-binding protein [Xanthomonas translucens pv. translucens]|uniref:Single-stranded DNA-binding protein n=2 Tax=Xanthomonas campestris pv. translucens TaxID=343 RepID=A0A109HHH7_XANCT|nr:single-stranded DNA-binding protein [Xanthomonas translucens]KWV12248.1 single-stranded DNA-binding protein [Xanthomonas translucens]QSQ35236.1 single-stranded DNA-binding protein [Xanthomonas translucens pv. translucens]QSQ44048.1 single-stranded DNA-binding protein [Xanthomonas translucens pv. translucens]
MSAIKVTVLDGAVIERGGTFEDDSGKERSYTTRKQKAKLEVGGFAYPFDVRLEEGQKPYAAGDYDLDIGSMAQVNKGVLSLSKFTALTPKGPPSLANKAP